MTREDAISRQAVIDSLYDWSNHSMTDAETWHLRQVIGDIKSMPSVTPKQNNTLDKIRAEITDCLRTLDDIEKSGFNIYLPNEISGRRLTYQQCLEFIDKYKAESED